MTDTKAWLCDDRGVTDAERPWLELPEAELYDRVIEAVEGAGYSETMADGIATFLLRKKKGLQVRRNGATKANYRRILIELGPPDRRRGQRGFASVGAVAAVATLAVSGLAAMRGNAPVALAGLYITENGPDLSDQELLAA